MRKVYIVNRSSHDFSRAEEYGELVFLSEGPMDRFEVNNMVRQFSERMKGSSEEDYLIPCALSIMNSIAMVVFALKHDRLNLLLYKRSKYEERNLANLKEMTGE
jgi:hypothetical protein